MQWDLQLKVIGLFLVNIILFCFFLITDSYPLFAIVINVSSIILLSIWLLNIPKLLQRIRKNYLDIVFMLFLFLLAFFVYSYKIDVITPGIHLDEITVAKASEQVLSSNKYSPFIEINYGHPTPLLYLTGVSIEWFGRTITAIRLPYVLFGALTVIAFYLLLRLFFNKTLSFFSSLLLMFSYPLIIVSRMAFEITPSLFFQLTTLIALFLAWKKNDLRYYVAVGLSLGAGLYTYVGFRTFALIIIALSIFIAIKKTRQFKKVIQKIGVLTVGMFIVAAPLLSYSLIHADQIMERAKVLSIFHQGLPTEEVVKELGGNAFRLTNLFLPTGNWDNRPNGDPDPRRNPSGTTFFDIITVLVFLIGIFFLFKRNKPLLLVLLILSISPIINDLLALERIPEGHYYGIGHPNTLRIAGIIPMVYFAIAFGLNGIKPFLESIGKGIYTTVIVFIAFLLIIVNWNLYFNQTISGYNYKFNGAIVLNIVNFINNNSFINESSVSSDTANDGRFEYFINKDKKVNSFKADNFDNILSIIKANNVTILNPTDNYEIVQKVADYVSANYKDSINIKLLHSPIGTVDAIIFTKI